jgi:hypothetical protein
MKSRFFCSEDGRSKTSLNLQKSYNRAQHQRDPNAEGGLSHVVPGIKLFERNMSSYLTISGSTLADIVFLKSTTLLLLTVCHVRNPSKVIVDVSLVNCALSTMPVSRCLALCTLAAEIQRRVLGLITLTRCFRSGRAGSVAE